MESIQFGEYLMNPERVQKAFNFLEDKCDQLPFEELYTRFEEKLGIKHGEGFPTTVITIDGQTCRARINDGNFPIATNVSQIGVKLVGITQGRANPNGRPIFYGANRKLTAAFEVLQGKPLGAYIVTIGCWESENGINLVNLVDGSDSDFQKLQFVHSYTSKWITEWPDKPKESALIINNFFREKFKLPYRTGLYNITNIIAAICYSLVDVNGVGYAAISDDYEGFNIAIKDPSLLTCTSVERFLINKVGEFDMKHYKIQDGFVQSDGSIMW